MSSTDIDMIKKEIDDIKAKLLSTKYNDEQKEIYRDRIKELTQKLQSNSVPMKKKIVPVETNSIIADTDNIPTPTRFIKSDVFIL